MDGIIPSTENKIIPGIKKLSKGIFLNSAIGSPINSPVGEIMRTIPPPIALNARKPKTIKKKLRVFFISNSN